MEWLLQNGADVKIRETRFGGSTALELGVCSASVASLLLNYRAEWSPTAFASAIYRGDKEAIRLLPDTGDFVHFDLMATEFKQKTLTDRQREAVLLAIRHCAAKQAASGEVQRWLLRHVVISYNGDMFELDHSDGELMDVVCAGISGAVRTDDSETTRPLFKSLPPSSLPGGAEQIYKSDPDIVEKWLLNVIHHNSKHVARLSFEEFNMNPNIVAGPRSETPLVVAEPSDTQT